MRVLYASRQKLLGVACLWNKFSFLIFGRNFKSFLFSSKKASVLLFLLLFVHPYYCDVGRYFKVFLFVFWHGFKKGFKTVEGFGKI